MSGNRFVTPVFTPVDVNGAPVTNAKLYFYQNNSNTPKNSWSDVGLTVLNAWPVVASGTSGFQTDIFLDTAPYREVLTDQNDVVIWDKNDCNTFNAAASTSSFPFPGAVVEFYGNQNQLNVALASFWYVMDGTSGTPNLNAKFSMACIDVASIGGTGGSTIPTGTVGSHTLTIAEIPSHTHPVGAATAGANVGGTAYAGATATATSGATGGGGGHNHPLTMDAFSPPYYKLIKLVYVGH